ncbi:hypothetical protein HMPREF0083_00200 [Aneurinibacillus aneurinilyticus ATCC 12856]|uniref:Uncharacterized protein n=1 Tax=Aneurinibacillus aneurinilyticus ATCC 12856 TaxID=649747 RepID=U1X9N4_ANEAE|nr:hypothetical protein HMPREF0083_00200 [Aneurinibacillus aneurinilyticus ATCC 12856]
MESSCLTHFIMQAKHIPSHIIGCGRGIIVVNSYVVFFILYLL